MINVLVVLSADETDDKTCLMDSICKSKDKEGVNKNSPCHQIHAPYDNVSTMPEYLRKRFGGQRIRIYMSVLALLLYIFTKISADLYAGALFIKQSLGLNMYVSVVILLAISAVFTMAGGLTTSNKPACDKFVKNTNSRVNTSFNEVGKEYNNPSDEIGCSNPDICKKICGSESGCSNIAYPLLVLRLMPAGLTGLMLSVMMAALMSSLTSIFNSASTIFTIDIYNRFRRQASEVEQVIAGRIFVLFLVAVSILWIPIIESSQNSQLFNYIQSVTSYLAPPVCAVYVLAMFWGRINEKGAFWGLIIGLVIGIIRFVMEFSYSVPTCGSGIADPRPTILSKVHYLHFGIILFIISSAVTIAISLLTKPIDEKHLYRLTYWSRGSHEVREDIESDAVAETETCGQTNNGFVAEDGTESATTGSQNNNVVLKSGDNENRSRLLYTLCCVGSGNKSAEEGDKGYKGNDGDKGVIPLTKEEEAIRCANDVKETPVWRSVNNLFAILVVGIGSFFWGYYA
ncbi:unnamed protein product [Medioppia subpectinata]|uniref:Sodium/glucose cotransporter 4 n=1 Tax=Medioppia subpectinata TaxID=1979941 RepID=A0A7R9KLC8_9ACAR|nr:unnamed protein product [Medioppia subpectinata]CAG2104592.1 unnamed protein product [Medioppia subpectinata]